MLDTNICIYLIKKHPPSVGQRFAQCKVGEVVMSAITYAELAYGVSVSGDRMAQNEAALEILVQDIPVMGFDQAAGRAYGPVRLSAPDRKRDALDKLIATHAIALDVTLVTNNVGDFACYAGLRTENWVVAQ
ncbi:type II toxin-antitoxin system VapC family toxin [Skermanella rosea]|uniref:type II toxin-antitoxin system VapC family toxin n=1 Tax=Skermanella rosea TaxID=1817965 RepID=UPI0019331298|nr:type II toxin-antitoxin system VapC family toxin [Skermanella rosea]UEM01268.1 type II toxin-antitoxin system VapC family toxin [Skermanella rosea]